MNKVLPAAPFDRILRKCGAERVSEEAAQELRDIVEDIATNFAIEASKVARHAGRKTIKEEDIALVARTPNHF